MMSTYEATAGPVEQAGSERSWVAPAIGGAIYLVAVGLNFATTSEQEQGVKEWVVTLLIAAVGVAVATWAGGRAQRSGRLSMAAMIVGVVALASIVVFYFGFPCVFGATAIALGLRARRIGSTPNGAALAGILLGAVALGFGAVIMVVG